MQTIKVVFTGCVGSGKSAAVKVLSDINVVSTDVDASDEVSEKKDQTTVAMDYGECVIDEETTIALFGTPGQERFRYMWEILAQGALGIVILVDNSREDPLSDLDIYLDNFATFIDKSCVVVGVTHTDVAPKPAIHTYHAHLEKRHQHLPVYTIDAREKSQVLLLMETLVTELETLNGANV
ncbi:Uncharacterised protein [BD1-7 clade bacterium]|uniref:GTP-binding protein n=1 Tax=BD1-7 clade bacterium TaxID=2029982 RepID=A0A5S9PMW9_9GAMM|nr:Uncharacterised protein [BD1-7 clade bacterium]CAA0105492.1 Uncharacterised protein [BD1-7 clade bacterium]